MKQILNSVLGMSLILATSTPATFAFANGINHSCGCVSSLTEASGKITSLSGDVLQSGKAGYTLASEGSSVSVGSLLSVGARSAAKVSFGPSCSILVPANSELKISLTENASAPICASVTSTGQKEALTTTFESREAQYGADLPDAVLNESISEPIVEDSDFPVGYLLLGAAVAGGIGYGIFELVDDDDDDDDAAGDDPDTPTTF